MATIQNQKVIQKLIDELELYPALEKMPTELAEKILPVFQVNEQDLNIQLKENLKKYSDDTLNSNDKTLTVPDNKQWTLKQLYVTYVSNATVGNRVHGLVISDADGQVIFINQGNMIFGTASTTRYIQAIDSCGEGTFIVDGAIQQAGGATIANYIFMPKNLKLLEGYTIRFYDMQNTSATDDFDFGIIVDEQDTD